MLSHESLKVVADTVNPILGLLAIALPITKWRGQWRPASMQIGVTLMTVALTYLFRAVFDLEGLWASRQLDFSTHTAICVVLVIALSSLDWKRAWIWCVILIAYAQLMTYQHYHTWIDIGTTAAVMVPFSALIRYWGDRLRTGALQSKAVQSQ
jgi:hypothetical protein